MNDKDYYAYKEFKIIVSTIFRLLIIQFCIFSAIFLLRILWNFEFNLPTKYEYVDTFKEKGISGNCYTNSFLFIEGNSYCTIEDGKVQVASYKVKETKKCKFRKLVSGKCKG